MRANVVKVRSRVNASLVAGLVGVGDNSSRSRSGIVEPTTAAEIMLLLSHGAARMACWMRSKSFISLLSVSAVGYCFTFLISAGS